MVSIFKNLYDKTAYNIPIEEALDRIQIGKQKEKVEEIRNSLDKAKSDALKQQLPAVTFAGTFLKRGDGNLIQHSGFIVLDFDKLDDVGEKMAQMAEFPHTFAAWVSPSGNGVKALIKIADGAKHYEHFDALCEHFPELDKSGRNLERLCFESYDPHMFRNPSATPFAKYVTVKEYTETIDATNGDVDVKFKNLLRWMAQTDRSFTDGNRNRFIYILAGACCRYGIPADVTAKLITREFPPTNDFTAKEIANSVKSAHKRNKQLFNTVAFEKEVLIEVKSNRTMTIDDIPDFDPDAPSKDVVYASEVKTQAIEIYNSGYGFVHGIQTKPIDDLWKPKRGELTCLTGIGNYGKSQFIKWYFLMRVLMYGEKFASFSPEDNPPQEYYHDFVEMLLGCDCTPSNPNKPPIEEYIKAYDWIGQHIFYLYPQDEAPTPEYIKARFLELIVKEKIDGCCIDPFNQLSHSYGARSDKYLESLFGDFARFAQKNQVYFVIVAHPKMLGKQSNGNYPCPDVFDLNDGAMWNNKMDNILVYHRPMGQTEPNDPTCEFHSKKIKRQKVVGKKGFSDFTYTRHSRRFQFGLNEPMAQQIAMRGLNFKGSTTPPPINPTTIIPIIQNIPDDFWNE